jgi:hypothetical protein
LLRAIPIAPEESMAPTVRMKRASRAVRIGATPYGKGVFAKRRFKRREVIGEIQGAVIDDPNYGSNYCMDFDGRRVLEPSGFFRYVNHSCEPNCELVSDIAWDEDACVATHRMYLTALADIPSGEQLTIDYAWPAAYAIRCQCSSPTCRGWIVDPNELEEVLASHNHEEVT